ncbi:MAG: hydroxylamine reductase, partial [Firmicutes bacterium]|nr:hydroxylamine reductase [Bacillota bacterium]
MKDMFCFQCEQTAKGTGCEVSGVCGKTPVVAGDQDKLIGACIGLAKAVQKTAATEATDACIKKALFTTVTNVNFDDESIKVMVACVDKMKADLDPTAEDYDMAKLWDDNEDIRSLKTLILLGVKGVAAYAHHAAILGYKDSEVDAFFYEALVAVGSDLGMDALLPLVLKTGDINLKCMALLDKANTETYGTPVPTEVPLTIEKGPFIIITGHDLHDLKLLLEQTEGKGVNIYTHGEMLPTHAYPKLKKYKHLVGNYG